MAKIIVVGLGPGDGRFVTRSAWEVLSNAPHIYLRTAKHPTVADLPAHIHIHAFDHLYEAADSFQDVYAKIVTQLLEKAKHQEIIYAVPGDPFVGESTVTALVKKAKDFDIEIEIEHGVSFLEPMLTAVELDVLEGAQIFDALSLIGRHIPLVNPDVPLLVGQVYNKLIATDLKLNLMTLYPDEHFVYLVHAAGSGQFKKEKVHLFEIDRLDTIAHLTSLYVPPLPYRASLPALAETIAVLRSPQGCPWDQEQTPQSMRASFLEEAVEVLEALDKDDEFSLAEELGDMFFHLLFQIQMANEAEKFTLTEVLAGIDAKLRRRHPHVWGDKIVGNSQEVVANWEEIKKKEKGETVSQSILDNISITLPALARSQKIQERAGKVGFEWPAIDGVFAKLAEEINELKTAVLAAEKQDELGDVLFSVVNLARWMDIDAESALREANIKFIKRFEMVEQLAAERQIDLRQLNIEQLEDLWQEGKQLLNNR